jgi:autotransporter-associated beta strand protein
MKRTRGISKRISALLSAGILTLLGATITSMRNLRRSAQPWAALATIAFITLALVGSAQAQYTWIQTAGGTQQWGTSGNWLGESMPPYEAHPGCNFTAELAAEQTVALAANRYWGATLNLGTAGNSSKYNFSNNTSIFRVNAGNTGTCYLNIMGGGSHIIQGTVNVQADAVVINNNAAGAGLNFYRSINDSASRNFTMTLNAVSGAVAMTFGTANTPNRNNWGKLVVNQHAIFNNNGTVASGLADDRALGKVLSSYLADAITLNGGTLQTAGDATYNISVNRGITLGALGGTFEGGTDQRHWTVDSKITGAGGLTVNSLGNVTLNAANDYTGATTVQKGSLKLGASGSIATSSKIDLRSGATFDVSAIDSYTLSGSTTLSAAGTGATVGTTAAVIKGGTTVSLGSQAVALTFTPTSFKGDTAHPALVVSQGALTLNNNTISVENAGGAPLGTGTYRLIEVTDGTIAGTPNAAVTVTGSGIAGGTPSLSVSGGYVNLIIPPLGTVIRLL